MSHPAPTVAPATPGPAATPIDLATLRARLVRFALRETRDPHAAEDAAQETLIALACTPSAWRGESRYDVYAIGILKHKLADQQRARWRETPVEPESLDELRDAQPRADDPVGDEIEGRQSRAAFWSSLKLALDGLPARTRTAFVLREVQDWDTRTVCAHMGVTPVHLAVMTHRARAHLKARMSPAELRTAA